MNGIITSLNHLLWQQPAMAEGEKKMKSKIHPKYNKVTITCTTCGNTFESGSVLKEIRVDSCSKCHPFYTGQQKFIQAAGRVERFNKRLNQKQG
jgi:large subunit ribosomal protein L31